MAGGCGIWKREAPPANVDGVTLDLQAKQNIK